MEKLGNKFSGPIWVEMKFNWSHGHSTPKLVKVHGGALGDTYFKPTPSNYKIVWQVRNEDFFALRWGVPDFIRQHIALNGRQDYVGGYFVGSETYIPALDYFTALEGSGVLAVGVSAPMAVLQALGPPALRPEDAGRAVPGGVHAPLRQKRGATCLQAYALASNTQLRLASLYDSRWDFTLYSEGLLALQGEHTNYIGVDALIKQPTLDPAYVSVADFVRTVRAGGTFGGEDHAVQLADLLERDCPPRWSSDIDARRHVAQYEVADVRPGPISACISPRSCAAPSRWTFARGDAQQAAGHRPSRQALAYWDEVIRITRPLYSDMKLTHYNGNSFDANPHNLFHWALIRDEVATGCRSGDGSATRRG